MNIAPLRRTLAVFVAALALCWVAVVNGQPFFHPDTVGYVRGADVAMMKLLGPRFATAWALHQPPQSPATTPSSAKGGHSYDDQDVVGGRSIYYGVLVSLGGRVGGFWLTVLIQSLAVALLVDILLRAARIESLAIFAGVIAVLALGTAAPFFAAFLMPDIWAGLSVAAIAALFAFPDRLNRFDIAALAATAAFAAMAHASVAPVTAGLLMVGGLVWVWRGRKTPAPWLGVAGCVLALVAAVGGGAAFTLAVKHTAGRAPITPPFLTARVVADGSGTRFVRERCAGQPFVVCRYADRLPLDVDHFLWGQTDKDGVFLVAPPADRRALGDEQTRFALAVATAYPWDQAKASLRNAAWQEFDTELSDFTYKPSLRASFAADLPDAPLSRLKRTPAYREAWPINAFWMVQSAVVSLSLLAMVWMARWPGTGVGDPRLTSALLFAAFALAGVLGNGAICGVLSTLYGRYQARVVWVLPLAAMLVFLTWRRVSRQPVEA